MISLCFFSAFICCAYSTTMYCYGESQCTTDIIDGTVYGAVFGYGYKSLFQSPSSFIQYRNCNSALSCKQTPSIDAYNLFCYGAYSCSNSASIKATHYIYGYGANSLMNTNISTGTEGTISIQIQCHGYKSCAHSTILISNPKADLYAGGALSLFATTIKIITSIFKARFYGYYAGYQSIVHCDAASICNIYCGYTGCAGLSVICGAGSVCNINCYNNGCGGLSVICGAGSTCETTHSVSSAGYGGLSLICEAGSTCNTHCARNGCGGLSWICDDNAHCNFLPELDYALSPNTSLELDTKEILFLNSTQITATNEDECSKQITDKTFDNYKEHYYGKDLIYTTNVGAICCRATSACSGSLISYDSNAAYVVCSGESSCENTEIISNSTDLMVECSAYHACSKGSIAGNGGTVYCYAYGSCYDTAITKMSHIYCTGYLSCGGASITSSGINITVYLNSFNSGVSITCNENDHCTILCDASGACNDVSLYCYGTCFVECNQGTGCPKRWTANPTTNPTTDPTAKPTAKPTANPTLNLTTKQTVNTKTITIIAVAVCAFLGTTICVFLYMNKRRNAKPLNDVEFEAVEGEECVEVTQQNEENVNLNEQGIGMESGTLTELPTSASIQMITSQ